RDTFRAEPFYGPGGYAAFENAAAAGLSLSTSMQTFIIADASLVGAYQVVPGFPQPFSALGDVDGDGFTNAAEAAAIAAMGGTVEDFVVSALNPLLNGAGSMNPAYVNFNFTGTEEGTELNPFNTLQEGVIAVVPGGLIHVTGGISPETPRILKPLAIDAPLGLVRIGDN
ncbi:MAG: hypothetical protein HYV26_06510, partial [Candidatus Hydrogenedentes bacterium]|nr:hypothetical protein [Candidatus Hydrogenedentota bacterium]